MILNFSIFNFRWRFRLSVTLPGLFSLLLVAVMNYAVAADTGLAFSHDETYFPLDPNHSLVDCDACHIQGVFIGTPMQCWRCHSSTGRIRASVASPQHISTTRDCDLCHQSGGWSNVFKVDHFAVQGSCQSCHNGITATGKNPGHIQSSNLCDDCHRTFSWSGTVFDHSGIVSNCFDCHNGIVASGKNQSHLLSTNTCEDCHSPNSWSLVIRVDHSSVIGSCFSCHNGVIATGKVDGHIASSNDCATCHSSLAWKPAF